MDNSDSTFYCYAHVKRCGTIFYIGKGHNGRAWTDKGRNRHWQEIASKNHYDVVILAGNMTSSDALKEERLLINHFRKFGQLVNIREGGGTISSSLKGKKKSEKHREKLAKKNREYDYSRYEKSSKTLSVGEWVTPNGSFHSLRVASLSNNCSIMTVRNRCLGSISKKGKKLYPVDPKEGWKFKPLHANMS